MSVEDDVELLEVLGEIGHEARGDVLAFARRLLEWERTKGRFCDGDPAIVEGPRGTGEPCV